MKIDLCEVIKFLVFVLLCSAIFHSTLIPPSLWLLLHIPFNFNLIANKCSFALLLLLLTCHLMLRWTERRDFYIIFRAEPRYYLIHIHFLNFMCSGFGGFSPLTVVSLSTLWYDRVKWRRNETLGRYYGSHYSQKCSSGKSETTTRFSAEPRFNGKFSFWYVMKWEKENFTRDDISHDDVTWERRSDWWRKFKKLYGTCTRKRKRLESESQTVMKFLKVIKIFIFVSMKNFQEVHFA